MEKILESVPDYLKSTQKMLMEAFPNGINQECYWALICLLYDYMADENLALVMSSIIDKPLGVITNDIYKVYKLELHEKVISEVKCRLNECGFEKWKEEN